MGKIITNDDDASHIIVDIFKVFLSNHVFYCSK